MNGAEPCTVLEIGIFSAFTVQETQAGEIFYIASEPPHAVVKGTYFWRRSMTPEARCIRRVAPTIAT